MKSKGNRLYNYTITCTSGETAKCREHKLKVITNTKICLGQMETLHLMELPRVSMGGPRDSIIMGPLGSPIMAR